MTNSSLKIFTSNPENVSFGYNFSVEAEISVGSEAVTWITFIIMVIAVLINGICLVVFWREKKLRTNFGLHIIHLTISDFFYATFSMGNFFVMNLLGYWPFGIAYCAVYKWAEWLFGAVIVHVLLMIAVDRIWALCYPLRYRRGTRTKKVTNRCFIFMYVYLNVCIAPLIAMNWSTQLDPLVCEITLETPIKQWWGTAVNLVNFVIPHAVLLISYGFIAIKFRQRSSRVTSLHVPSIPESARMSATVQAPADGQPVDLAFAVAVRLPQNTSHLSASRLEKDRAIFTMFSYLCISMSICWIPADIFWTWYNFDPDIYQFSVSMAVTLMMYLTAATHPILYQAGNKDMRVAVKRLFRPHQRPVKTSYPAIIFVVES